MIWFYSDPHFDHNNIIYYCNRPFLNRTSMNVDLLTNYHNRVQNGDTVYFLGDMCFGRNSRPAREWLSNLQEGREKVKFYYIKGSHDNGIRPTSVGLPCEEVSSSMIISLGFPERPREVLLIHNPADTPEDWDGWVIHGHVHNYRSVLWKPKRINVSCDAVGFRPVSESYIVGLIYETEGNKGEENG